MPNFHRFYIPGSLIFITAVTNNRQNLLMGENIDLIWSVLRRVQEMKPFHLTAYCFLPDHFHWVLKMPENNPNYSDILQSVKRNFTWEYKKENGIEESIQLWQARFWDHVIRNEKDLENHIHYIHYNPVKHGYVECPEKWKASSFDFWRKRGFYPENWEYDSRDESMEQFGE